MPADACHLHSAIALPPLECLTPESLYHHPTLISLSPHFHPIVNSGLLVSVLLLSSGLRSVTAHLPLVELLVRKIIHADVASMPLISIQLCRLPKACTVLFFHHYFLLVLTWTTELF